jgi:uncharacterized protein (DUF2336 family)
MAQELSQKDVERLLTDPSVDVRAEMAGKVAAQLDRGQSLTAKERALGEEIVRLMARDAAARVRVALAESVKSSPLLPRDVALTLARDIDEVALPVLELSSVLTDDDLLEVLEAGNALKQTAVARRPEVSERVADAVVATGAETAVAALVGNPGAQVSDKALETALERFPESEAVATPMAGRARLPVHLAERLVGLVSETLRQRLVSKHSLPEDVVTDLVLQARERATLGLALGEPSDTSLERLVRQLQDSRRLTPSLLLRAVCTGDIPFFEMALSILGGVPVANARLLIHDAGGKGLASLYERAGLPANLLPAFRVALDVARETPFDGEAGDWERHRKRMIERILTQYDDLSDADVDYLVAKLPH